MFDASKSQPISQTRAVVYNVCYSKNSAHFVTGGISTALHITVVLPQSCALVLSGLMVQYPAALLHQAVRYLIIIMPSRFSLPPLVDCVR